MNKEQIQTINWYRKNKNLVEGLTKDELSVLKENLGEYFDYIFNGVKLKRVREPKGVQKKSASWIQYKQEVKRITKLQPIELLENSDKPKAKHKRDFWSKDLFILDHKISIWYGYNNNIPPEIIGDIENLRWITAYENSAKGVNCVFD